LFLLYIQQFGSVLHFLMVSNANSPIATSSSATLLSPQSSNNQFSGTIDKFLSKFDSNPIGQRVHLFWKEHSIHLKPWADFFDTQRFKRPANVSEAVGRFNFNIMHFKTNYGFIVFGLLLYALITNLFLLFSLLLIGSSVLFVSNMPPDSTIKFGSVAVSQKQMYGGIIVLSIPLLWISAAGQSLFWIIGASALLVGLHACTLEKSVEQEFQSSRETA
jgi:hypothetical protein